MHCCSFIQKPECFHNRGVFFKARSKPVFKFESEYYRKTSIVEHFCWLRLEACPASAVLTATQRKYYILRHYSTQEIKNKENRNMERILRNKTVMMNLVIRKILSYMCHLSKRVYSSPQDQVIVSHPFFSEKVISLIKK